MTEESSNASSNEVQVVQNVERERLQNLNINNDPKKNLVFSGGASRSVSYSTTVDPYDMVSPSIDRFPGAPEWFIYMKEEDQENIVNLIKEEENYTIGSALAIQEKYSGLQLKDTKIFCQWWFDQGGRHTFETRDELYPARSAEEDEDSEEPVEQFSGSNFEFIELEGHEEEPWGAYVNFDAHFCEWKIQRIERKQQAHRLGVQVGWRIRKVDDMLLNKENSTEIQRILSHGEGCIIVFEKNPRNFLFRADDVSKWNRKSMEREVDEMQDMLKKLKEKQTEEDEKKAIAEIPEEMQNTITTLRKQYTKIRLSEEDDKDDSSEDFFGDDSKLKAKVSELTTLQEMSLKLTESLIKKVSSLQTQMDHMKTLNHNLRHEIDVLKGGKNRSRTESVLSTHL